MGEPELEQDLIAIEMTSTHLIDDYTIAGERYVVLWDPDREVRLTFKTRTGDHTELQDKVNFTCDGGVCTVFPDRAGQMPRLTELVPLPRTVELLNGA